MDTQQPHVHFSNALFARDERLRYVGADELEYYGEIDCGSNPRDLVMIFRLGVKCERITAPEGRTESCGEGL